MFPADPGFGCSPADDAGSALLRDARLRAGAGAAASPPARRQDPTTPARIQSTITATIVATADLGTTQHRVAIWGFGGFEGSKVVWFSVKGGVLEQELGAGWLVCSGAQPMRGRPAPTQIADASIGGGRGGVG